MGFKFLSLHSAIPMCFHLIGPPCNAAADGDNDDEDQHHRRSRRRHRSKSRTILVIGSDCRVRSYDKPVSVADLMRENPLHLVCRSDSFFIGQRVPTLSPAELLKLGHSYLLLPATFFHSNLSFLTLASFLACPVTPFRPFDIKKTDSGSIQVRVSDEFLERMVLITQEEDEKKKKKEKKEVLRVCNTVELEKDYKQLVRCKSKHWKPKLETIKESSTDESNKRSAAGVKVFSRIKRRKKKKKKKKNNSIIKTAAASAATSSSSSS